MPDLRKECIFIMYNDIIKTFKPFLMKKLLTKEYRDLYEEFLDYRIIENASDKQLLDLSFKSNYDNILALLAKKQFNFNKTYYNLLHAFDDMVDESPTLNMGSSLAILINQNFVDKIYIYTDEYDERIRKNVSETYKSVDKLLYVSGDFRECIKNIEDNITSYIINNINLIDVLIEEDKVNNRAIMILDAGYNYEEHEKHLRLKKPDIEQISKDNNFKCAFFKPVIFE